MSIIKLSEPWCFNAMSLEQSEVRELQKHFVNEDNHQCDWFNTDYCGITSDGLSEYFSSPEFFDEDDNVTVYTIEQLRAIIAKHLAKQPVEKLENDVVYYVQHSHGCKYLVKVGAEKGFVRLDDCHYIKNMRFCHYDNLDFYTKATPEQIAHYEACVKTGKYVEPESVKFDYVKCVEIVPRGSDNHAFTVNKVYTYPNTIDDKGAKWDFLPLDGVKYKFEPSTEAEYLVQNNTTQFVVGKWYKYNRNVGKFSGYVDGLFTVSEYIYKNKHYAESANWGSKLVDNERELIEDLSEIQDLLPDGHEDKWVKTAPKSERYLATMKFFEQLREPERSEAIANYDEEYSIYIPKSLEQALSGGFCWDDTELESDYWEHVHGKLLDNTYFQEEILVFGKYKIGDIVVRTFGEPYLYKIAEGSTKDCLRAVEGGMSDWSESWRPATPEEVKVYNKGFRNVANIEPKLTEFPSEGSCKTNDNRLEEYFRINGKLRTKESIGQTKDYICWNNLSWWVANTTSKPEYHLSQLEPFLLDIKPADYKVVPEYVECVRWSGGMFNKGRIYHIVKSFITSDDEGKQIHFSEVDFNFKPSTKEVYDKQQEKLKMEELLNEAKRRYPAGTKYKSDADIYTVVNPNDFNIHFNNIRGEHNKGLLCNNGVWAEIVKEEPKPAEIKPAKGMHVRCLKENNWSDGKTKVGQVFEIEGIDWAGDMWVNNHSFAKERLERGEFELLPDYKEEPWTAQVGDWVYVTNVGSSELKVGEILKCSYYNSKLTQQFGEDRASWLVPEDYRKATQEEINSVTITAKAEAVNRVTVTGTPNGDYSFAVDPEWTADNWYVEVSSQKEANAVIDAAAKMYGLKGKKSLVFDPEIWKYVCKHRQCDYIAVASCVWVEKYAKSRPITDFIQPEIIRVPDEIDCINSKPLSPEECYKPQQDELVIYKPKRVIL